MYLLLPFCILLMLSSTGNAEPDPQIMKGVYICGPEFGNRDPLYCNENPGILGKDYWFNTEKTFEYFANKGFSVFRIPLTWERLQPALGAPIERVYLALVRKNIGWAKKYGVSVVLDIMNQARYSLKINTMIVKCVIDAPYDGKVRVTSSDFEDLWRRLSSEFKTEPGVFGYGLMDEPHDMGQSDWKKISRQAVAAIRGNQDRKPILLNGDNWSSCDGWEKNNPVPWIEDPVNDIIYEASCYLDQDGSGAYSHSYEQEMKLDSGLVKRGQVLVSSFLIWCKKYKVRGNLCETGIPSNEKRWLPMLAHTIETAENSNIGWAYWAGGEWWNNYGLSIQPSSDFSSDKPQMVLLEKYLHKPVKLDR